MDVISSRSWSTLMGLDEKAQSHRLRKAGKRVLLGETREEEAARLEKEIAGHPVTRCAPGERSPASSVPAWYQQMPGVSRDGIPGRWLIETTGRRAAEALFAILDFWFAAPIEHNATHTRDTHPSCLT